MPTTGTILAPCTGDTVNQPDVVQVGYNTSVDFDLTCCVNATCEVAQFHPATSSPGTHASAGLSPGPGTWTVFANNTTTGANLDNQPNVIVVAAAQAPVSIDNGSGMMVMQLGKKRRKPIKGTTIAGAVYVVCEVSEIDTSGPTKTIIAVGAAMVKFTGKKYTWSVQVEYKTKKPDNFQYVARVTAYDKNNLSLGTLTQVLKK